MIKLILFNKKNESPHLYCACRSIRGDDMMPDSLITEVNKAAEKPEFPRLFRQPENIISVFLELLHPAFPEVQDLSGLYHRTLCTARMCNRILQ